MLLSPFFICGSCDAKEKETSLERQSLYERQRVLQQGQDRLLDGQALLNQREEYIFGRAQELNQLEKELDGLQEKIENRSRALNEEKSNLDLNMAALIKREEVYLSIFCCEYIIILFVFLGYRELHCFLC